MRHHLVSLLAAGLAAGAVNVEAQILVRPPRTSQRTPPAAGDQRVQQELTLRMNVLGGRDENSTFTPTAEGADAAGLNTYADLRLRYRVGTLRKSLETEGQGYMNAYPNSGVESGFGGEVRALASATAGHFRLTGGGGVRYDPFFQFGVFSPSSSIQGDQAAVSNPATGVPTTYAVSQEMVTTVAYRPTERRLLDLRYNYRGRNTNDFGGNDTGSHALRTSYVVDVGRSSSVGGQYQYWHNVFSFSSVPLGSTGNHSFQATARHDRRVSRTRQVGIAGTGGADRVSGLPPSGRDGFSYWTPTGEVSAHLDLGRTWVFRTDVRRTITTLDQVSQLTFPTTSFVLRTGGQLGPQLQADLSGEYASGRSGENDTLGRFQSRSMTGQLAYVPSRYVSFVVNYGIFRYRLRNVTTASTGLPDDFTRGALRAGVTLNWPVVGRTADPARPRARSPRR